VVERALERLRRLPRFQAIAAAALILLRVVSDLSTFQFIGQTWEQVAPFLLTVASSIIPVVRDFSWVAGVVWIGLLLLRAEPKSVGGVLRAAPPPAIPPLPQYGLPQLPSTVTPEYLITLFRENTEVQARGLVKPFLGRWINVAEPMHDVSPDTDGITTVTLARGLVIFVHLEFNTAIWGGHIAMLKKGQVLSATGVIDDVNGVFLRLKRCEIPL
jgi:hypothetical protein